MCWLEHALQMGGKALNEGQLFSQLLQWNAPHTAGLRAVQLDETIDPASNGRRQGEVPACGDRHDIPRCQIGAKRRGEGYTRVTRFVIGQRGEQAELVTFS